MSRCAGCRSRTVASGRARLRSPATRKWCWHVPRTTSRIRRSASCSSRRSTTRRARPALQPAAARAEETPPWAFHVLGVDGRLGGAVEWETDRARFLGRGRSPANPVALDGRALSGTTGAVLDPVAALRERVRLAPGAFVRVTFATGVAPDRAAALALARKYRDAQRGGARVLDGVHARAHHAAAPRAHRRSGDAVRSAGVARLRHPTPRASARTTSRATCSGSRTCGATASRATCRSCWCASARPSAVPLVRQLLHAQEYWRRQGPARRRRDPERASGRLPRRDAGALTACVQEPRWARLARQAGRHVPAARRRHARGRPPPARPRSRESCCAAISAIWRRSSIARRRGSTTAEIVPRATELRSPAPRRRRRRSRRWSWRTASAASRPTAANTSSSSTAIARRRCRGRTCSPTRSSARS